MITLGNLKKNNCTPSSRNTSAVQQCYFIFQPIKAKCDKMYPSSVDKPKHFTVPMSSLWSIKQYIFKMFMEEQLRAVHNHTGRSTNTNH